MDVARIKHAVAVTPDALFRLIPVPYRGTAAMRTGKGGLLSDADVDMDLLLFGQKFSALDVPRLFQIERPCNHVRKSFYHINITEISISQTYLSTNFGVES